MRIRLYAKNVGVFMTKIAISKLVGEYILAVRAVHSKQLSTVHLPGTDVPILLHVLFLQDFLLLFLQELFAEF